jgi:RNA polymerase sigma-70 factor (ECF subfamily)
MGPIHGLLNRCSEASGSHGYGDSNVTIVITSVAFCGRLRGNFKRKDFSVDDRGPSVGGYAWPVAGAWDSLTGGQGALGGGVLGFGGEREAVSRVGLTAADLVAARRREPAAVTRIYTAYAPALFRFFMAAVGDRHQAEDLTGTTFVSAIESLPRFRGPIEALGGWLFQIARHDLYDHRRKQSRSRIEPLEDNLNEVAVIAGAEDPEELAIARLEGSRVLAAMRELSPDQREVLLLRMGAGLTAPEVAEVLGKTTGAVKSLQFRGLASLARVLGLRSPDQTQERPYPSPEPGRLTSQEGEEG